MGFFSRASVGVALVFGSFALTAPSQAQQVVKVVSQAVIAGGLRALTPAYEQSSGNKLEFTFGNPQQTIGRLRDGMPADVVIYGNAIASDLAKENRIDAATRAKIASVKLGMAIPASATKPDMSNGGAITAILRAAHKIAVTDPKGGGTTTFVFDAFEKLGLTQELTPKLVLIDGTGEDVAEAVAAGKADIGFSAMSELAAIKGVQAIGPLPPDVSSFLVVIYAVVTAHPANRAAAREFISFLQSPGNKSVFASFGLDMD
jgi:molybdate transport system substrate-binding protein